MTAAPPAVQIDVDTLAAVSSLQLRARLIVEGLIIGMHRSARQGVSFEFAQHRQYAPGDDLRHLDWKVFARSDKLYLKQYQKETNLDLVLVVDASGSMAYTGRADGRWRKYDLAASVGAAMAYLALKQQDRVALVLFGDRIIAQTRLSNARDQFATIIETLEGQQVVQPSSEAGNRTDLGRLFDQVTATLAQRSLVVLLSDLFDEPAALQRGLARLAHRRHDLILMQILDPDELTFPFRDPSTFVGLEAEGSLNVDPASLRRTYLSALSAHLQHVEQLARGHRYDYLLLNSAEPVAAALSRFLARRQAGTSR